MPEILIGTYNMSFAGDSGLDPRRDGVFESEGAFHLSNPTLGTSREDLRLHWKNALEILVSFFNIGIAAAVGLQEMNLTASGSGVGSDAVEQRLKRVRPSIQVETQTVPGEFVPVGISLVWDSKIFGEKKRAEVVDLNYVPTELPGLKKQLGRPMLMVLTEKGYLLVSLHAPNQEKLAEATQADLILHIGSNIAAFAPGITANMIFIMGDFNDAYDAIAGILRLPQGDLLYSGKAPLSCCHNWDGSCKDDRYISLDAILSRTAVGKCDPKGRKSAGRDFVRERMDKEGDIEYYRYYGDKVFGTNPATAIQMFPSRTGPSHESDHEMVFAGFIIEEAVGGRRKKQIRRRSSTRKLRKHIRRSKSSKK